MLSQENLCIEYTLDITEKYDYGSSLVTATIPRPDTIHKVRYTMPNKYEFVAFKRVQASQMELIDSFTYYSDNHKINSDWFPVVDDDTLVVDQSHYLTSRVIAFIGQHWMIKPTPTNLTIRFNNDFEDCQLFLRYSTKR